MPTYNQQNANLSELFKAPDPLAQIKPMLEMMQVMKQIQGLNAEKEVATLDPILAAAYGKRHPGYTEEQLGVMDPKTANRLMSMFDQSQKQELNQWGALNTMAGNIEGLQKMVEEEESLIRRLNLTGKYSGLDALNRAYEERTGHPRFSLIIKDFIKKYTDQFGGRVSDLPGRNPAFAFEEEVVVE